MILAAFLTLSLGAPATAAEPDTPRTGAASAAPAGPTAPAAFAESQPNHVEDSVVRVFSTARYPDVYKPWTKQAPREISGSGVVIEGKRILTNAHIVLYASQVQVQANQAGDKISATVQAVAPGIDLAVLKLDSESFFDSHPPLPRASTIPEIKDPVMTYGFPTGGTSLSITKGIVSRIEFATYSFPAAGLRIQIDAAMNPGNSGGPAVVGDKMIGLAFSHLRDAQNIGYIIPCEEIELFLKDIAAGRYGGKPALFGEFQTLENPALRTFLKLDKAVKGLVVREPYDAAPGYPLKQWDVITRIGDTPVDDEGMVRVRDTLRVRFLYLVQKIARNGKVPLTVVRAGKEIPVEVPVISTRPLLIPDLQGAYPSYFVYGSLVFSPATLQFVGGLTGGNNAAGLLVRLSASGNPLMRRLGDTPGAPGEELVVVASPFFPHRVSNGYSNPVGKVVKTVNGIPIKNLRHLVEVLRDSTAEFTAIEFEGRETETLVFSHKEMLAATEEILTDNGIRSQGSSDTLAVWSAKPTH
jgi:S1-C subfamily serine protease